MAPHALRPPGPLSLLEFLRELRYQFQASARAITPKVTYGDDLVDDEIEFFTARGRLPFHLQVTNTDAIRSTVLARETLDADGELTALTELTDELPLTSQTAKIIAKHLIAAQYPSGGEHVPTPHPAS